jgi:dTDP-4-amino-4,6-dideoxygalactose transaminase
MKVPFLDLKFQHHSIKDEIKEAIGAILDSQQFVLGPVVEKFEREMAKYSKAGYAIGVASGTDALLLSLMAIKLKAGDSVITTPFTFFATAGSISRLGAFPLFVDIDPRTYNIDPQKIEEGIERRGKRSRPKAIIPVHLYGQCADMSPIMEIARRHSLMVIEDAAQALGAEYFGQSSEFRGQSDYKIVRGEEKQERKKAGSIGDLGCFSFFPSKNLGGFGDGGMVVTDNDELAKMISILRVHGISSRYYHKVIGCNSRLDSLQAAILSVKLKYLDGWIKARQMKANYYNKLFIERGLAFERKGGSPSKGEVILPSIQSYASHSFNYYVIRVKERDLLSKYLKKEEIGTQIYYPLPLHRQECYTYLGYKEGDFPEAERAAKEALALPIYPELSEEMQEYVVEKIGRFFAKGR